MTPTNGSHSSHPVTSAQLTGTTEVSHTAKSAGSPSVIRTARAGKRGTPAWSRGLAGLFAFIFGLVGLLTGASRAHAQTARVVGAISNFGSTLTGAAGVDADSAGNIYVVTSTGVVYKEVYDTASGTYTETNLNITTATNSGSGIAVDANGANIYVATGSGDTVVHYTGSGTSYSLSNTISGFTGVTNVALDLSGNLFVSDAALGKIYKNPSGTSPGTAFASVTAPRYLTVDANGIIFTASLGGSFYRVSATGTSTALTPSLLVGTVTAIAVDSSDNLYIGSTANGIYQGTVSGSALSLSRYYQYAASAIALDSNNNVDLVAATQQTGTKVTVGHGYLDFGSVGPGVGPTLTVAFTETSGTANLGTPSVVTQGLTGYDFSQATSGSTCSGTLTTGSSCTVVVQFSPQATGSRLGAVNLVTTGGKTVASSFLGGVGFTPLAAYQSVTLQSTITTSLSQGRGITVDPAGNVWVANQSAEQILKFPAGSSTPVPFATSTTCKPSATALDGQGNLYYSCNGETNMYELVGGAGTAVKIPVSFTDSNGNAHAEAQDDHLSADAAGNLYTTSYSPDTNYFLEIAAGSHTTSLLATAPSGARFVGAVTDAAGNTFAPDYNNNILYELQAGSSSLTKLFSGTPLQAPHAIAEDAAGSLYVTTTVPNTSGQGNSPLLRFAAGSYTSTPAQLSVPGGDSLWITPDGDFYTVYSNTTLAVYTRTVFSLTFPDTLTVGQTSAPQTVVLENDGTGPLTISPLSSGQNPSVSPQFTYDPSSTCPSLSTNSAPYVLQAGASCTQVIEFTPTQAGSISGQLITTDNSANVTGSTQTIKTYGTANPQTPTVSVVNTTTTLGGPVTLSATISYGGVAPTGQVSFAVGVGASVNASCTQGSGYETCTASYPTTGLVVSPGTNTITATLAADANYNTASGTGTLTVNPTPTTTTITSSSVNNTSNFGDSVTFTAKVTSNYGIPSGAVTFYDGSTVLKTVSLSGSGTATYAISTLTAGSHTITASYLGATNYATSTASLTQIVKQLAATSTDTATGTGNYGDANTSVTVSIPFAGPLAPTGLITVADSTNSKSITIQASSCTYATNASGNAVSPLTCTASFPTSTYNAGTVNLKISQAADNNYAGSTGTGTITLNKIAATTNDAVSGTGNYGDATVPVTVTIPYTGPAAPSGAITVKDPNKTANTITIQTTACSTATAGTLTCTGNFPTAGYTAGTVSPLTITQVGDTNYVGTSGTGSITLNKTPLTTTDTASGTGTYGSTTIPVTVRIPYAGAVAPTGAVTVTDSSNSANTVTVQASTCTGTSTPLVCSVNFPSSTYAVGTVNLTVSQAGDSNYLGSNGSGTLTVNKIAITNTDTATGTGTYGAASVPVTVTIPYSGPSAPTGAVTVSDGKNNVTFSACSAASGKLTCTGSFPTAGDQAGTVNLTLNQAADANYAGSTGTGTITLNKIAVTTTDSATGTGNYGATSVPVTVSIPYAGPNAPTGQITVTDGKNTLTIAASSCTATASPLTCTGNFNTTGYAAGTVNLTVAQAGDNNYLGSSGTGTLTINKIAATTTDTVSGTGTYGATSAPVTVKIPFAGSVAPTGTITVSDGTNSITIDPATCTSASGVLTCSNKNFPTAGDAAGTVNLTVSQAGDTNYAGSTGGGSITLSKIAATTGDGVTGTGTYGATSVPVTVTIPYSGPNAPTGAITVSDGKSTITIPASACTGTGTLSCSGTFPTAGDAAGTVNLTVSQAADNNYSGSTGAGSITLAKIAQTTTDSVTGTGTYGATSVPVTVTIPYSGPASPTGVITVSDGKNSITIQASACTAANNALTCNGSTFPTTGDAAGTVNLTVSQAGDSNYVGSNGTGTITLNKIAQTTGDTATGTGTYGAATTPIVVKIPFAGSTAPTGQITVTDANSNTLTIAASSCTAASGVLTCAGNFPTAGDAAGNVSLSVAQAGDSNYSGSTGSGNITLNKIGATSSDAVTGTGTYGAATTPITVSIPYSGPAAPTGQITVSDGGKNTITLQASGCTATSGVLSCSTNFPTAGDPAGSVALTVAQAADNNYAGSTGGGNITLGKAAATTADSVTGSATYGATSAPITITIPYGGSTAPTGLITVSDNASHTVTVQASACTAANGSLTCTTSFPTAGDAAGSVPLTVSQASDSNYSGSTGNGSISISKIGATGGDTIVGTGDYGAQSTSVKVTIPYAGSTAPTGAITITDGYSNTLTFAASACSASGGALNCVVNLPTHSEPVGSNPATVSQLGDANYSGSTGGGNITINPATATTNDSATGAGAYGAASSSVTITIPYAGTVAPTGAITLSDTYKNTVTVQASACSANGSALTCTTTLPTANEPVGANSLTVSQAADKNYNGSTGTGTLTISKASGNNNDTASGTGTYGAPSTSVKVQIPYAGTTAPTGAVTVADTHSNMVTVQASTCTAGSGVLTCNVTLPTANEPAGANSVTVSQVADSNYAATTGSGTVSIAKAGLTNTDKASGNGTYGAPTTAVTITIPFAGVTAPTGTVTVTDTHNNSVSVAGTACSASGNLLTCTVNLPTANEPVGANTVTIQQGGDANYLGSTGTGTVNIDKALATTNDTANGTGSYGAATTPVVVTIPYAGTVAPTGAITVADSFGNTLSIQASTCTTSGGSLTCTGNLPTANEPIGTNPLTVKQAGDSNYSGSTGAGTLTINQAGAHGGDSATGSGSYGSPSTPVTVLIPYSGSTAPTGAIMVADTIGNTVTVSASTCTASGGALVCVISLPTANEPVGNNVVNVAQAADGAYAATTGSGSIAIGKASSTTGDTATGTGTYGALSTPVTVTIPYAGTTAPTGTVTVVDSLGNTGTAAGSSCTAANGKLTCTVNLPTANEPLGPNQVTVSQAADSNYSGSTGTGTVTINMPTSSPVGSSAAGVQNVTITQGTPSTLLTATLAYNGTQGPTGALSFTVAGGSAVTATCTAGASPEICTANYPTDTLQAGTYVITATEAADSLYPGGSATGTLTVATAGVAPVLDSISNVGNVLITAGAQTATFTASIVYSGPVPTGALTFNLPGGTPVTATCTTGPSPLTCTADYPTASLTVGTYVITATEAADATYPQGAATGLLTVQASASTPVSPILITGSHVSSVLVPYGTSNATLTATIDYNGPIPTGMVTFTVIGGSGGTVQGTCTSGSSPLTCTAVYPTGSLNVGGYQIQVTEAADTNYPAGSAIGTLTVTGSTPSTSDTVTGNGTYGSATTPVTVSIAYTGGMAPTGAVTVTDTLGNTVTVAASTCTAANGMLTCAANLPTANVPVGSDTANVKQAADSAYAASTGSGTITIGKAPATTTDTATGNGTYGAPTTSVTVTIPYTGVTAPTGAITLADSFGNTATIPAGSCTAASGTLTCTTDFATANEPLGNNPVTVTQVGDSNYIGSTGNGTVTISKGGAGTGDTATGTGTFGAATTAVNITIPFVGQAAPTGAITLTDTHNNTVTIAAAACTASSTTLSCVANLPTATEPVGANAVTVSQAADSNYAGSTGNGTVTINKVPATTNDTATGTGTYGAATTPVTITIPYATSTAPTGAITLTDTHNNTVTVQASSCTAANGALTCTANLPTASEPVGANSVSIAQAADGNYAGSTGTGTVTINKAPATTTDTANGTGIYAAATTSVTVNIPYVGQAAPTGAVTVTDNLGETVTVQASTCTAASNVLTCTVNLPTANQPVGTANLTVSQAADTNYEGSTGTGTLTINKAAAAADTAAGTGNYGDATTPVTVTIPFTGANPTGAITLADTHNNTVTVSNCTANNNVLTCTANLPTLTEPVGSNTVTVNQAADANHAASTGTGTVTINKAPATSTDTVTGTGTYGSTGTQVTVTIPYTGQVPPSGAITVSDTQGNTVTIPPSACTAANNVLTCTGTLPTSNLGVGTDTLTVSQAGDNNYTGSTGSGGVTINKAAATPDTATGTGTYGSATTPVTVTIPYTGAAPTGIITLADTYNNTVTVTGCTSANSTLTCTVNLPTANEPVGANTVTINQAADANHAASTGTGTITIHKAPATSTDTVTGTGTYGGATTTVTVSIPYTGQVPPSGAITVADSNGNTVTVAASSCTAANNVLTCTANLPTSGVAVGTDTLTVSQAPDSNYSGSTGTGSATINKGAAAADTATGTGTYGTATTLVTVTIPYAGAAPTGTITLADTHGNTVTVTQCTPANGTLTCTVNLPTATEPVGANAVTVNQAGDANHAASTGTGTVTINKAPATSTDTVTGSGTYGSTTTQVTVTIPYTGQVPPSGAITVSDSNGNTVTIPASACTAAGNVLTCTGNLPTSTVGVGTDTLTVSQAGDSNYTGSTGSGSVSIAKAAAGADTANGTNTYGAATTAVTVTIPFTGATPTGAITLSDTHGTTVPVTNCTAAGSTLTCTVNLPTATYPVGANTVTVNQAADANHGASTGTGAVTITKAAATTIDAVTGTGTFGDATVNVTVTIPYVGQTAPTGAITIADSIGNTVTVQASACTAAAGVLTCTAALPTANEPIGTNTVTVTQAPDANYSGSTGTGAVTINKAGAGNGDTATGTNTYGAATTPVTVTIPYTGSTAPGGAISVTDTHGNTVTAQASTCTAAKGALTCTVTLPTANEPVGANTVTVNQAADTNTSGSTGTGTVTINKAPATAADTAKGTSTYGAATTPVTVTIPYSGPAAPTGAVTITDTNGNTVTVQASSCTAAAGILTCTANLPTASLPVGTDNLTVAQAADSNYSGSTGTGSVTVSKSTPTLTAPVITPMNAVAGTSVTITQTVPAGETGTVTFYNGTMALGTATISNGTATLTTSTLPAGSATITATANGDANYNAATSPAVTDNVGSAGSTVKLASSQPTTNIGGSVTFTATVTATATTGNTAITGTVTFYDGTTAIGTAPVNNGVATLSTTTLTAGTHQVTATFTPATGSTLQGATSAALTQTVVAATSVITLVSSANPAVVTTGITFTATVPATITGVVPTGKVTFYDGTTVLGTAQLDANGVAIFKSSTLTGGTHSVTATYAGDTNYATSTSTAVSQAVMDYTVGNTTPTLTANPGDVAAFTITIKPANGLAFSAPVVLTVTGLPAKYTAAFASGTVNPGTNGTTTVMSVQTFKQVLTAMEHDQHMKSYEAAAFWACLFPLLGIGRVRRKLPKVMLMFLLCLASFGIVAPLTGCGGGYFGAQPASYTLTVTGTSGTLQRTTTVTLNVH